MAPGGAVTASGALVPLERDLERLGRALGAPVATGAAALTPEEEAIVAAAMATTAPPEGPPMNRVDAWWNRTFPPFSKKRLVFGLAALPLVGALQELVIWGVGWKPSLPRYLFVCIAGGLMLSTAFLPGMREMAERLQRANGQRSPWTWRRRSGLRIHLSHRPRRSRRTSGVISSSHCPSPS